MEKSKLFAFKHDEVGLLVRSAVAGVTEMITAHGSFPQLNKDTYPIWIAYLSYLYTHKMSGTFRNILRQEECYELMLLQQQVVRLSIADKALTLEDIGLKTATSLDGAVIVERLFEQGATALTVSDGSKKSISQIMIMKEVKLKRIINKPPKDDGDLYNYQ